MENIICLNKLDKKKFLEYLHQLEKQECLNNKESNHKEVK